MPLCHCLYLTHGAAPLLVRHVFTVRVLEEVRLAFSGRSFYYVKAKKGFQEQALKNLEKQWINNISEDYG